LQVNPRARVTRFRFFDDLRQDRRKIGVGDRL